VFRQFLVLFAFECLSTSVNPSPRNANPILFVKQAIRCHEEKGQLKKHFGKKKALEPYWLRGSHKVIAKGSGVPQKEVLQWLWIEGGW